MGWRAWTPLSFPALTPIALTTGGQWGASGHVRGQRMVADRRHQLGFRLCQREPSGCVWKRHHVHRLDLPADAGTAPLNPQLCVSALGVKQTHGHFPELQILGSLLVTALGNLGRESWGDPQDCPLSDFTVHGPRGLWTPVSGPHVGQSQGNYPRKEAG